MPDNDHESRIVADSKLMAERRLAHAVAFEATKVRREVTLPKGVTSIHWGPAHPPQETPILSSAVNIHVHKGCPGYVRASLRAASRGGASGYKEAGRLLGEHLEREVPIACEEDEWIGIVGAVDAAIDDNAALTEWIAKTYPRIWLIVPPCRREGFVDGVRQGRTRGR